MPALLRKHPYAALVLACAALYFQTLFFGFTFMDDQVLILNQGAYLSRLSNVLAAFREEVFHAARGGAYYRPLLTVSYILDTQWAGVSPFIYHLTDIVLHAAVCCLLYKLLLRLKVREASALFFSLVFAVHPLLVQAVAWLAGRNDPLLALFILPSFIALIDYAETPGGARLARHLLFFLLALFTKELAVFFPAVCVLYHAGVARRKLVSADFLKLCLGWGACGLLWYVLRHAALVEPARITPEDMFRSVWANKAAALLFLGKVFLPFNQSVFPTLQDSTLAYGWAALALLGAALALSKGKDRAKVAFGLAWFLIFLVPAFIRPNLVMTPDFNEYRAYLPMVGMIIALCELDWAKSPETAPKEARWLSALALAAFAVLAFRHCRHFRNGVSYWSNAAKTSPHSPLAHRNLGAMHYMAKEPGKAATEYQKALELNPREPMAHSNLGLIYMDRGWRKEAELEFRAELAVNPTYDSAQFNLGLACFKQGKYKEAGEAWLKTLELNPDYRDAYRGLAVLYEGFGDKAKAAAYEAEYQRRGR